MAGSVASQIQARLDHINAKKSLNAFMYLDEKNALERARKLDLDDQTDYRIKGLVIGVKDNVHVAGMPNTAGTPALKDFIPQTSAKIVTALEEAGGVIIGKTGMHELAYGITSNNFAFGPVRNPVDETKTPGGSSGGSAAAVAANLVDVAIGTDTGGSVRLPAALTGTVGFRPSIGRYSQDGMTLISPTRDTIGFIAQSVSQIIQLDQIVTSKPHNLPQFDLKNLRLGVPKTHFFDGLDAEVNSLCKSYLDHLGKAGVTLIEVDVEKIINMNARVSFPIVLFETARALPEYLKTYNIGVEAQAVHETIKSPDVKEIIGSALGGAISKEDYQTAMTKLRPALQDAYKTCFETHDLHGLIFPTSPITARNIDGISEGVTVNGELKDTFSTYIQNTDPASNAGLPGISLPIGKSQDGLPIGIEIDAPFEADNSLLSIARAIEEAGLSGSEALLQ